MKRQPYWPGRIGNQVLWLNNFGGKVVAQATALGLDGAGAAADAKWLSYVKGAWIDNVRSFAENATEYLVIAEAGLTGGSTWPTPAFVNTTPPTGTVAVGAGALDRIFRFVQDIKNAPAYTSNIGDDLQIVGPPVTNGQPAPLFTLKLGGGPACQCVGIDFRKFTHEGVYIESRRGNEAGFTFLAIDTSRPWVDERPLLVPGQPEVRQYRLKFWDKGAVNHEWSEIGTVTVGP